MWGKATVIGSPTNQTKTKSSSTKIWDESYDWENVCDEDYEETSQNDPSKYERYNQIYVAGLEAPYETGKKEKSVRFVSPFPDLPVVGPDKLSAQENALLSDECLRRETLTDSAQFDLEKLPSTNPFKPKNPVQSCSKTKTTSNNPFLPSKPILKQTNRFEIMKPQPLNSQQAKCIAQLVGPKPFIKCMINGKQFQSLFDTGSMVSVVSVNWLLTEFPDTPITPLQSNRFTVKVANDTPLALAGVALLKFSLPSNRVEITCPFLVTDTALPNCIIGTNLIRCLYRNQSKEDFSTDLAGAVGMMLEGEAVINAMEGEVLERNVYCKKSIVIEPGECRKVPCSVPDIQNEKGAPMLFEPIPPEDSLLEYVECVIPMKDDLEVLTMNCTDRPITIRPKEIVGHLCSVAVDFPSVNVVEVGADEDKWQPPVNLDHLDDEKRKKVEKVLYEYSDVFSKEKTDIGEMKDFFMDIELTDSKPIHVPYRRIPKQMYKTVRDYMDDLIANGWIQTSESPYSSPIVCAKKKDGSLRLCIDYRALNNVTIPDRMPIPRIDDILDNLGGQKYFSTLDLTKAYHQGFMKESARKYTAFSTPWGLYEWLRIPMGLKNAPPKFQRKISSNLEEAYEKSGLPYLDDIITYGKDFDDQMNNLIIIFKKCRKHKMKLNPPKCDLFKMEIKYVGRLITQEGHRMDPASSEVIETLKSPPTNIGQLRSLLGFINCYRSSIKNFSRRIKPLYDLLGTEKADKKQSRLSKTPIVWTEQHQILLEEILEHLKSPEVMAFPNFEKEFVLHCDACEKGLGAVLYQENDDARLKVICYGSRTLSPSEENYHNHSGKLEFLSLKWSICDRFKHYLYYAPWFQVYSDNNPLSYVQTTAKLNAIGLRWMANLAQYNFTVKYRPGKDHKDCDFLSRLHEYTKETNLNRCTSDVGEETQSTVMQIEVLGMKDRLIKETSKAFDQIIASLESKIKPSLEVSKMWKKENRELVNIWEYLVLEDALLKLSTVNGLVVIVPKLLRSEVIKTIHEGSGHLGTTKCYDLAKRRVYWPGMKSEITEYITQTCKCVKDKAPNRKQIAPLIPIRSSKPFEIIGIDYLHLDKCKGNFEYLLVVTDHFSRFSQTFPTKNKNGKSAADRIFNEFVINYGFPDKIHHDQGKEFNNKMWDQLHHLSGIKKSNTTPYHPMGNGQTERFNRTIINLLKSLEPAQKKDWKNYVRKLCYAYNCTVNRSTGYSPHFLMFGRDPKIPIDIILDREVTVKGPQSKFVQQWKQSFDKAIKTAQKHHAVDKQKAKNQYDKTSFGEDLEKGDHVIIKNLSERGGTGKLRSFYESEAYVVVEKVDKLPVYVLKQLDGTKTKKTTQKSPKES